LKLSFEKFLEIDKVNGNPVRNKFLRRFSTGQDPRYDGCNGSFCRDDFFNVDAFDKGSEGTSGKTGTSAQGLKLGLKIKSVKAGIIYHYGTRDRPYYRTRISLQKLSVRRG